jgi:hypothetical protein
MANTVKRVNYYDHQFLRAPDFTDEQNYHLGMRRLHNSSLHTWGVVQGLEVKVASGGTGTAVTVSAGFAIDSSGQEIVLPADTNLELGGEVAGTTLNITIAYDEQQSDPTTEAGGPGNTRISEMPKLSFSATAPADKSMTLILAQVPRTATGLGTVDESGRRQAGVVLGSDLTVDTLTLKKDGVAQANWPVLSCSAANQAALANAGLSVSGSVGIGPVAADRNLSVNAAGGAAVYANVKNGNHEILLGVDTTTILSAMTASDLQIRTNNISRVLVQANTGNLGVGTLTPKEKLHIEGGSLYLNGEAQGMIVDSGGLERVGLMKYAGREGMLIGDSQLATPVRLGRFTGGTIKAPTTVFEDLVVSSTGFVGIGTKPTRTLDVKGTGIKLGLEGNGGGQLILANNPNDNKIYLEAFSAAGNGSAAEFLLTGMNGGNVPQLTFAADHVQANGDMRLASSDIYFTKTNHTHTGFGNNLGYAGIENDGNTYNGLMILGRTVSTSPLLRVVKMWDRLEMNGDAFKPGGGAWSTLSDGRLKENVNSLSGALDKLLRLRGVSFEWKDPAKHGNLLGTQMGMVAQEVEEVFPEWVGNDLDGTKTLSVRGFEALTVEAFRDLRGEIKTLRDTVAELQAKLGNQAADRKSAGKTNKASAGKPGDEGGRS